MLFRCFLSHPRGWMSLPSRPADTRAGGGVSEHVSVEVGPGGGPVAVKRAEDDDGRQRLRREAEVLAAVQGPGVVELVALDDDGTSTTLSTAWLGGGTFAAASLAPKKLAATTAALTLTVARLHERGVAHRRITGDHILLDTAGRVVLAGFAEASNEQTSSDAMADDVHDIGDLVLGKLPAEPPPVLRLRSNAATAEVVDRLRAIASRATDADPTRRPSARALAGLLTEVAGDRPPPPARGPIPLRSPRAHPPTQRIRSRRRSRRPRRRCRRREPVPPFASWLSPRAWESS